MLLDVLMRRDPFYRPAARVWTLAETGAHQGFVSAISFNNVFYVVRKHGDAGQARRSLQLIRSVFRPVAVDTRLLDEALAADGPDFEDTVQLCCALRCGANYLITRDHDGFREAPLPVVTADEMLSVLALDGEAGEARDSDTTIS